MLIVRRQTEEIGDALVGSQWIGLYVKVQVTR
jgi:hypothetical protein